MKEFFLKVDPVLKIVLLFFHFTGFSFWFAALVDNKINDTAIIITVLSGFFLVIREIIKDGLIWFLTTEGFISLLKIIFLLISVLFIEKNTLIFLILILFGILSAHLPKPIKNKNFFE